MRFTPAEGVFLTMFGIAAVINGAGNGAAILTGHVLGMLLLAYFLIVGNRKLRQHE